MGQVVEELDNLQSQLDMGNSELIQEDSFLVQLLANDAAGMLGHAVRFLFMSIAICQKQACTCEQCKEIILQQPDAWSKLQLVTDDYTLDDHN